MTRGKTHRIKALVDNYGAALVLYARQWCGAPDDAVQEALMELSQQTIEPEDPVAWLFTTTKRKAINQTRGESRWRRRNIEVGSQSDINDQSSWFVNELERIEESEKLKSCLEQLESLEREIVVAHIWGQLTFVQIAELVQLSSSSAHRHYQNAITKLRKSWEKKSVDPPQPAMQFKDLFRTQP